MKVIQFLCPDTTIANQLKALVLAQANKWSRLQYLAEDPEYITNPFDMDEWREHSQTSGLYWADYGKIYEHLGDHGRDIADQMFGFEPLQGILRHAPLVLLYPEMRLQIVDVQDQVAQGYLLNPEVNDQ